MAKIYSLDLPEEFTEEFESKLSKLLEEHGLSNKIVELNITFTGREGPHIVHFIPTKESDDVEDLS